MSLVNKEKNGKESDLGFHFSIGIHVHPFLVHIAQSDPDSTILIYKRHCALPEWSWCCRRGSRIRFRRQISTKSYFFFPFPIPWHIDFFQFLLIYELCIHHIFIQKKKIVQPKEFFEYVKARNKSIQNAVLVEAENREK